MQKNKPDKTAMLPALILLGLVFFQIALVVVQMTGVVGSNRTSQSNTTSFIPIWFIAFIPMLTSKNKENMTVEKRKKILWITVTLASLVLTAMIFVLLN